MPGGWIGRGALIAWPPQSPDFSLLDFFLWGYVKNAIYQDKNNNRQQLESPNKGRCGFGNPQQASNLVERRRISPGY
jgi:hypothetical protein